MICERCGTVFCWDEADIGTLGGSRKRFCSEACKTRGNPSHQKNRKVHHEQGTMRHRGLEFCASRGKQAYDTERIASDAAMAVGASEGVRLYTYECACGSWHLTSEPPGARQMAQALKRALFGSDAIA